MLTIDPGCLFLRNCTMVSVLISSWFHLSQRFSASCASTLRRSKATSTRARRSRGSWWHLSCSKFWRPWSYPKLRCRDYVDEIITVYCDGLSSSGVSLRRVEAIPARERERWVWNMEMGRLSPVFSQVRQLPLRKCIPRWLAVRNQWDFYDTPFGFARQPRFKTHLDQSWAQKRRLVQGPCRARRPEVQRVLQSTKQEEKKARLAMNGTAFTIKTHNGA